MLESERSCNLQQLEECIRETGQQIPGDVCPNLMKGSLKKMRKSPTLKIMYN